MSVSSDEVITVREDDSMASLTALQQVGQSFFPGIRLRLGGHCFARAEDISLKLFFYRFCWIESQWIGTLILIKGVSCEKVSLVFTTNLAMQRKTVSSAKFQ